MCAAVVFPPGIVIKELNDSKKCSAALRKKLEVEIKTSALAYSISIQSVGVIEELNILHASLFGMKQAALSLSVTPDIILVDGNKNLKSGLKEMPVVKGDAQSQSIAAASILAKECRDRLMIKLAELYPHYGWERNKGYPTREHRMKLKHYGMTPHHRVHFCSNILAELPIEFDS